MFQISIPAINLIANFFYGIFGSGVIMTLVIFSVVILTLVTLRANLGVSLLILIPLAVGFVLNNQFSNMVGLEPWILITFFMMAGIMFALFIIYWWTQ